MACTGLESLSLSGCLGVTGVGLAVVGETAPTLLKLDITNCQQLANWAFQRVCSGCPLLEDVNVSMCVKITDHDIRVLAENCPRLRKLNVRDTRQVSDEGLVAVSPPSLFLPSPRGAYAPCLRSSWKWMRAWLAVGLWD